MQEEKARELSNAIKRLPRYSKLIYRLYKEPSISKLHKIKLATAIGYLVSPVELVPGVIPVAGQLDDIIIVLIILRGVLKSINRDEAIKLLALYDLTFDILDADIKLSKEIAKKMILGTARLTGRMLMFTGKTAYRAGKWLMKKS